eukprot:2002395-Alexandrium_andersonii.AAC.1
MAAPYDNFAPPMVPDPDGQFVPRDIELGELREAMFIIRNCTGPTSRSIGDHIGTEVERHRMWQTNYDVEYMGTRSLFYHDCLDFMGRA